MIKLNWHIFWSYLFHLVHIHISYFSCAKAKTNMFPWVSRVLSLRLKGKWSIRRRQGFHSTLSVSFTLRHHSTSLSNWYNLSLIFTCTNGGESKRSPFLAINAKGGEILSPKQKDRTTNLQKFSKWRSMFISSIGILWWKLLVKIFQIGMMIFNWYIFKASQV
jgi:hypothetical protein